MAPISKTIALIAASVLAVDAFTGKSNTDLHQFTFFLSQK